MLNKKKISEQYPDITILFADGFEDAFIGIVRVFNSHISLYDKEKCIWILVDRDGMRYTEAEEFFEFHVLGAYLGENDPGFLEFKSDYIEKKCESPEERL